MTNFSTSKKLIKSTKQFLHIKHYYFIDYLLNKNGVYYGWGKQKSGLEAIKFAKKFNTVFTLLEDGFIRSLALGVDGSPSFSLIEDNIGIYYDATAPSMLENILNNYDFKSDVKLMEDTSKAIAYIVQNNISKYNNSKDLKDDFFKNNEDRVLVIAQTAGDASLKYGMLENYTTDEMIDSAKTQNPNATVYLKVHPDVLSGKKESDIDLQSAKKHCIIIDENINPLSLLKHFAKVYTKTSQMGFEALLVGCECICFGMPFYAGWGITIDKSVCKRRKRKLSIEEVFAAAYIIYTRYHNPYTHKDSDIFDTIETIIKLKV